VEVKVERKGRRKRERGLWLRDKEVKIAVGREDRNWKRKGKYLYLRDSCLLMKCGVVLLECL